MSCTQSPLQNDPQQLRVVPSISSTSYAPVALAIPEPCWGTARRVSNGTLQAQTYPWRWQGKLTQQFIFFLNLYILAHLVISVVQIMIFSSI